MADKTTPNTMLQVDMRAAQRKLSSSRSHLRQTTQLDYRHHDSAAGVLAVLLEVLGEIETVLNDG